MSDVDASGIGGAAKKRGPPAFQMYAPDRLADRTFKAMRAAERGLLHSIELECWVNGSVPADHHELARILSMDAAEVEAAFTERVWRFLERREGTETVIVCPDLDEYRAKLEAKRASMSTGGRKGADSRWKDKPPNGDPNGDPKGRLRGEERKGEERKGVVFKESDKSEHREWLDDNAGPSPSLKE